VSTDRLKSRSLGVFSVAALGSVMMAPALGIYANLGLISASAGLAAPAVFLVALLCTLPTAVSYSLIAREIPSAGSAYTWLSDAVNPWIGTWMGLLLVLTYLFCVLLQPILFGIFFSDLLATLFGIQSGYGTWLAGVVISTTVVTALAYPGVEVAAKTSLLLSIIEAVVVLALSLTILAVLSGRGSIQMSPFNPLVSLGGSAGFSRALVFGLLCFVGFGVIATAAEETDSPREIIPKAMIVSCVVLGLFWAIAALPFSLALVPTAWGDYVARGINPIAVVAKEYWSWASILITLTAITAVLGVHLASMVGYSRVAYAMGRDRALPEFFGRLHPKYLTPWNAQHVATILTLTVVPLWGWWIGTYLSYDWWGSAVVFFSMLANIFVSIGCCVFFYRFRRDRANWFWHFLIPLLGVITSIFPLYFSFGPELWNLGWKKGQSVIIFSGLVVLSSLLYTALLHGKQALLPRKTVEER
jgi:amino acid transporter